MNSICLYLIDDLGTEGEYAGFLNTYKSVLPPFSLKVFTHYHSLLDALSISPPDILLADMRFDTTPPADLYGNIDELAQSDAFCGNIQRAEAQIRGMQGLLISRALRQNNYTFPIILFASLPDDVSTHIQMSLAPIVILPGLILNDVKSALLQL